MQAAVVESLVESGCENSRGIASRGSKRSPIQPVGPGVIQHDVLGQPRAKYLGGKASAGVWLCPPATDPAPRANDR